MAGQVVVKQEKMKIRDIDIEKVVFDMGIDDGGNVIVRCPKNEEDGLAKVITYHHIRKPNGPLKEYYAKMGSTGTDRGMLFNPKGMFANYVNRQDDATHTKYYIYKRVTEKCFELYKHFLRTGNQAHLRNAQREV